MSYPVTPQISLAQALGWIDGQTDTLGPATEDLIADLQRALAS